jgi:dienelactone hydrolase
MGAKWLLGAALTAAVLVGAASHARGTVTSGAGAVPHVAAPQVAHAVGERVLMFARGADRPLPTTVWYPAAGVAVAAGRFPLVLFSHGLHGGPHRYAGLAASLAAAGFVVAAPAYPHTRGDAADFLRADIRNQPADAAYVLGRLRRLGRDPLAGHIDADRVAAIGHSAGGYTTTGLFSSGHAPWLRAGVVIAGWAMPGAFDGPAAPMLFVHGVADAVVGIESGRAAYDRVAWPRAFLALPGHGHGEYLEPRDRDFAAVTAVITDFLSWTLYGDRPARERLSGARFSAASLAGQKDHPAV